MSTGDYYPNYGNRPYSSSECIIKRIFSMTEFMIELLESHFHYYKTNNYNETNYPE